MNRRMAQSPITRTDARTSVCRFAKVRPSVARLLEERLTNNNLIRATYTGNVNIVNSAAIPDGAGWSPANVEQLVPVTGGVILVNSDGTSLWFASNGGSFTAPAGDFSPPSPKAIPISD
jgi:hypothetical protein